MARTAAEQDLDVFLSMINQNCAAKLAELDREAFVAKCLPPDDAVAKSIADRRQRLIELPHARLRLNQWAWSRPDGRRVHGCAALGFVYYTSS